MKAVLKYFFVTLLVGFSSLSFSQNKAKTVTLDGVVINLDEISEDMPFKVAMDKSNGMKKSLTNENLESAREKESREVQVYTNSDKTHFFKTDSKQVLYRISDDVYDIDDINTSISFFNLNGEKKWESKSKLMVNLNKIKDDGQIVCLSMYDPSSVGTDFLIMNSKGETIYKEKGSIEQWNVSDEVKGVYSVVSKNNSFFIRYYSITHNCKWEKSFPIEKKTPKLKMTSDGEYVTSRMDGELHVWNYSGVEVWRKSYKGYAGFVFFNSGGKYLLWDRKATDKRIEIYDLKLGKLLFTNDISEKSVEELQSSYIDFIKNSEDYYIMQCNNDRTTDMSIFSINGNLKKKIHISNQFLSSYKIVKVNNKVEIYFDNILVDEFNS